MVKIFNIFSGIDGFTRMIVFMNVSNNNRCDTVHRGFLKATDEFGWPCRIRTDYGVYDILHE